MQVRNDIIQSLGDGLEEAQSGQLVSYYVLHHQKQTEQTMLQTQCNKRCNKFYEPLQQLYDKIEGYP